MFTLTLVVALALAGLTLMVKRQAAIGLALVGAAALVLGFTAVTIVPDGHVAVTRAFGQFGRTLQPGFNLIAPWESTVEMDTRVQSFTFSDDTDEAISGPITGQALGGGNLTVEHTIQLAPSTTEADDLLRQVGSDWFEIIALPAIRSCTRDATTTLTLEQAYTSGRAQIGDTTEQCVTDQVGPRGVNVFGVLIRDVDPGPTVRAAIDSKQEAEQNLQRAEITLRQTEVLARQEAVRAFGISQAEQIIACGGREVEGNDSNGNPVTVIEPNESCDDQFSAEYLQWLYIQQLADIDGVVILPPEFDGQLFVNTGSQS